MWCDLIRMSRQRTKSIIRTLPLFFGTVYFMKKGRSGILFKARTFHSMILNFAPESALLLAIVFIITFAERWLYIIHFYTLNWDENTFYSVAKQMSLGHLPYTNTFENKPPLSLLPESLAFLVGIDSGPGLRVTCCLILTVTGVLLSLSFTQSSISTKLVIASTYTSLYSIMPSGQAWMTELNINFLFSLIIYLMRKEGSKSPKMFFLVANLVGCIPLVRSNWSFVALALLIQLISKNRTLKGAVLIGLGSAIPSIILVVIYLTNNKIVNLYRGFFLLPMMLARKYRSFSLPDYSLTLIIICSIIGVVILLRNRRSINSFSAPSIYSLSVLTLSLGIGLLVQAPHYSHQSCQLLPFLVLFLGTLIERTPNRFVLRRLVINMPSLTASALLITLCIFNISALANIHSATQQSSNESQLVRLVEQQYSEGYKTTLTLDNQFIFWRTKAVPLHPLLVHPSLWFEGSAQEAYGSKNLSYDKAEYGIFNLSPQIVVESGYHWMHPGDATLLKRWLKSYYKEVYPIVGEGPSASRIWERINLGDHKSNIRIASRNNRNAEIL
jgi:hypothetical protein